MAAHSHSVMSQRHDEVMSFDANVIPKCEFYCKTINQKRRSKIIRKVSKEEAAKTRKPCGYCYGYIRRDKDLDRDSTYNARLFPNSL